MADDAGNVSIKAAIDGEPRLLEPHVRASADLLEALLDPAFTTSAGGRRAHRSSLWRRNDDRWQRSFHQATTVPEA
jgi:hypothetical protein